MAHAWSVDHEGVRLLILGGRCHLYEGLTPVEVVHPLRTAIAAGCRTVITAAAGASVTTWSQGRSWWSRTT